MTKPIFTQGTPEDIQQIVAHRHESVRNVMRFFAYSHLSPSLRAISKEFYDLAVAMLAVLNDSAELVVGLRKLLEAKDCFVRSATL